MSLQQRREQRVFADPGGRRRQFVIIVGCLVGAVLAVWLAVAALSLSGMAATLPPS